LGNPSNRKSDVAAARAVGIASAATDGQTGRVYGSPRLPSLVRGLTREAWRLLTRQPGPAIPLRIEYEEAPALEPEMRPR
jgi:hypothetical protein